MIQPIKVFCTAIFVAGIIKKDKDTDDEIKVEKEKKRLARNEEWLHQAKNELSIFNRSNTETLLPPDEKSLSRMRALRYKERKMKSISTELVTYLLFTATVFLLGFTTRDYRAFHQTRDIEDIFRLKVRDTTKNKTGYLEKVWQCLLLFAFLFTFAIV